MADDTDPTFFDRADAHIRLSNDQLAATDAGMTSASMMYAAARFNAWVTALGFRSGEEMAEKKEEILRYFTEQYQFMLRDNLDDYISRFEDYMKMPKR